MIKVYLSCESIDQESAEEDESGGCEEKAKVEGPEQNQIGNLMFLEPEILYRSICHNVPSGQETFRCRASQHSTEYTDFHNNWYVKFFHDTETKEPLASIDF